MTDRPIIFSGAMVRALLDGRKTQTRRLAWNGPKVLQDGTIVIRGSLKAKPTIWQLVQAGDRLWVRENWKSHSLYAGMKPRDIPKSTVFYAADHAYAPSNMPWVPSIFMPRWASRLTLTLTDVRRQRLQEITEADATAEGVEPHIAGHGVDGPIKTCRTGFVYIWQELHGVDSWLADPEIVALTFTVARANIDAKEAA